MLELRHISKSFPGVRALDDVSLEFRAGEIHALLGENGAGKSTLLAIVAGEFAPDEGTMEIAGRPYRPGSPRDARAEGISLIHQEISLFHQLTVAENVLMGTEPARRGLWDRGRARSLTREVLA